MIALTTALSVHALAWTLVHFLWQGAAVGVVVFLWLRLGCPSAQVRYTGGILTLAALLLAPVTTFTWLVTGDPGRSAEPVLLPVGAPPASPISVAPAGAATMPPARGREMPGSGDAAGEVAAVAIVSTWALGVAVLSMRLAGGWILARRVARVARPAAADVCALAATVSRRLGLTRVVSVAESTAVSVPVLIGWLKPVVLFPAAALSGLSTGQIEALMAHELAHVRRHDYLVNILQTVVETLLFYHPATWFVSREVREAREQCCDDLATGVCDRVVYVSALADLAAMTASPRLALAATGGALLPRVQRLLGYPYNDRRPAVAWLGALSLALIVGAVVPAALGAGTLWPDARSEVDVAGGRAEESEAGSVSSGPTAGLPGVPGVASSAGDEPGGPEERPRREEDVRQLSQAEAEYLALFERLEQVQRQLENGLVSSANVRELQARFAVMEQQVALARAQQRAGGTNRDGDARSTARLEATLARARAELDAARADYERSRQLLEAGVLGSSAIRQAEERLAAAERELAAATIEARVTAEEVTAQSTIDARRAQLQAASRISQAELELAAARERFDTIKGRFDVGTATPESLAEVEIRLAAAEQRVLAARAEFELTEEEIAQRQMRANALRRLVSGDEPSAAVTDPAAQAQSGDILSIEIAGEPDLPRTYRIDSDGAIRLPLVGAIRVAGMTAQQVREAVSDALTRRQLGEGRSITVTLRRPK